MAENWQDATCQQVKLIAGRLNELLSTGLDLLHSELGVNFGVKPEIPPWLIFLAACIGLVLMVAMWASACRGLFKKRPTIVEVETVESTKPAPIKVAKTEEPKKTKRKTTEKKSQPNGSVVAELQEDVRVTENNLPVVPHHSPQIKTEKASEVKKTKKKQKQAVKEAKTASSHGKESEEVSGTWETKISNKEKREQRRKDKSSGDGSGSPGGVDPLPSTPPTESTKASPKAAAPGSVSEKKEKKKKKGESSKTKAEKADAVAVVRPQAISSEEALVVTEERPDLAVTAQEAPALTIFPDEGHWTTPESNQDTAVWGQGTEGGCTVIDVGITSEPQLLCPSQPKPQVEDEWSGLNGDGSAAAADGCSDWNAPAEEWENYGELPAPVEAVPPALEEPLPETAKVSEEREKAETTADGTGKLKKKKKKKKKQAEDAVVTVQESEDPSKKVVTEAKVKKQPIQEPAAPTVQAVNAAAVKARVEQPVVVQNTAPIAQVPPQPAETKPTAKQNSLPAPTHKESQPSKPVMKKKRARRET
ncbi:protein LYRIC-like isoform X2 [Oncorhynchus keta]|uniref:protein LYRIC-like isoform X2 n=1 Tax=Oncorhynchus keta TaxID=8018 RepID=UPI0015F8B5A3|nr:protein LYRIC-like isoform X2 [Oncorhynchus keta]